MTKNRNADLVYSTDQGRICPVCSSPINQCTCREKDEVPDTNGIIYVSRETKGRKGKGVTIIKGVPLKPSELKKYAKKLKQKCSSGGSIKDGTIEIQGDFRDLMVKELTQQGYTVKLTGG